MNYEKKYKGALEKARQIQNTPYTAHLDVMKEVVEDIFPELKENGDERIRKELIKYFKKYQALSLGDYNVQNILVWLEKQGKNNMGISESTKQELENNLNIALEKETTESWNRFLDEQEEQKIIKEHNACEFCEDRYECVSPCSMKLIDEEKYTNIVGPEFNIGDIITNGKIIGKVDKNENNKYHGWFGYDKDLSVHYADIPDIENWRLWTIKDAREGDILACEKELILFKSYDGRRFCYYCWYNGQTGNFHEKESFTHSPRLNIIVPATKEQQDLLFQKMHEASYEWDSNKKKLKKIENVTEIPFGAKDSELQEATYYIPKGFHAEIDDDKVIIKKGEKPIAWSEEDKNIIRLSIENLTELKDKYGKDYGKVGDCIDWLESLKERVKPKQEWSEKDGEILEEIINNLKGAKKDQALMGLNQNDYYNRLLFWLESLRPHNRWKPSESDILLLERIANGKSNP